MVQENCFRWGDQRSLSKLSKWHLNRPKYWERCSQTVIIRSLLGKLKRCWYVIFHDFSCKHSCGNCLVKPLESVRHPPPILLSVPNISHSSLPAYPQATETVICWILSSAVTPTDFCMDDLVSFPGNLTYVVHFSRRICETFCNPVLLRDLIMLCGSVKEYSNPQTLELAEKEIQEMTSMGHPYHVRRFAGHSLYTILFGLQKPVSLLSTPLFRGSNRLTGIKLSRWRWSLAVSPPNHSCECLHRLKWRSLCIPSALEGLCASCSLSF